MTKHIHTSDHNPGQHSPASRQQFYLGFLAGAVVGAGIAFLSASKKSGDLKKDLLEQAKQAAYKLPGFLDEIIAEFDNQKETASEQVKNFKEVLVSDPDEVNVEGEEGAKVEKKVRKEVEEVSEPLVKVMAKTAAKAKRFFSKAGRMLGK
jgi:gas vesicle protein